MKKLALFAFLALAPACLMANDFSGPAGYVPYVYSGYGYTKSNFPYAQNIMSTFDSAHAEGANIGLLVESKATLNDATRYGYAIYAHGLTNGSARSAGVVGEGNVTNTSDSGSAIGVRGYANDTHAGGMNIGLLGDASGGLSNYSLYMTNGDIYSGVSQTWTTTGLALVGAQASMFAVGANGGANPALKVDTSTASSVTGILVKSVATGGGAFVTAQDSASNATLNLASKGTSSVALGTGGTGSASTWQFAATHTASAVNYMTATGATTTNPPYLIPAGSDANVDLGLKGKGTGSVQLFAGLKSNAATRAVQNTAAQAAATIAAGMATTYIATPAAGITVTLAAPLGDGERRRIVFGQATTVTWAVTAPATSTDIDKTVFAAGEAIELVYNAVAGTPTNSNATTWYVF